MEPQPINTVPEGECLLWFPPYEAFEGGWWKSEVDRWYNRDYNDYEHTYSILAPYKGITGKVNLKVTFNSHYTERKLLPTHWLPMPGNPT